MEPIGDPDMKKMWTIGFALALFFAAFLDLLSTYLMTPDLKLEANPFFVMLGPKWVYLITFKVGFSLVALLVFTKSLDLLQSRVDRLSEITGFFNVFSYLIFKRKISLNEFLLHKLPKDWHSVFAVAGITIGTGIVTAGVAAGILNSFAIIQSQSQIVVFFVGNAILTIGIALWLIYQFLVKLKKSRTKD